MEDRENIVQLHTTEAKYSAPSKICLGYGEQIPWEERASYEEQGSEYKKEDKHAEDM